MRPEERDADLVLAASRGVLAALAGQDLADAARGFRYRARTHTGDAFETAFMWAQEEARRSPETHGAAARLREARAAWARYMAPVPGPAADDPTGFSTQTRPAFKRHIQEVSAARADLARLLGGA